MFDLPHLNFSILKDRRKELRRNCTEIEDYIVDFCCRGLKLIIEVDGPIHQQEDVAEYDLRRSDIFKGFGYKILRFTNEEVLNNVNSVFKAINDEILSPPSRGGGECPRQSCATLDGGEKGRGV